jgi:hypothetical protein
MNISISISHTPANLVYFGSYRGTCKEAYANRHLLNFVHIKKEELSGPSDQKKGAHERMSNA